MKDIKYRIPKEIYQGMIKDLQRQHEHAYERIGFLFTRSKFLNDGTTLVTAIEYCPVDDNHYIEDSKVGARINGNAIRNSMQNALRNQFGVFHIHLHDHKGKPRMSWTDEKGIPPMVESFTNVAPDQCHGNIILSRDSLFVSIRVPGCKDNLQPSLITIVGYPCKFFFLNENKNAKTEVYDRQSFLGEKSTFLFENVRVGVIGYGGGGSHIGLQLAHIGVINQVIFDHDHIEASNLNRLVGGWHEDLPKSVAKIEIAKRTIENVLPVAKTLCIPTRWQDNPEILQGCDIVVGCVDSFLEREQLEAECRRYLIPMVDIGMDVRNLDGKSSMSGQVILSMPGGPCMHCFGFLTTEKLGFEAAKYGKVGGRPQVVWPNGVLASTAVGIIVDIITGWTGQKEKDVYLSYDGNQGSLIDHIRLKYTPKICTHYNFKDIGQPQFLKL